VLVIGDKLVYGWLDDVSGQYLFELNGGVDIVKSALIECLTYTRHTDMGTVEEAPRFVETCDSYDGTVTLSAVQPVYDNF
jgi:hypothetical protein